MSIILYNTSITRPNTSTKEARAAKIGLYFTFLLLNYIFSEFLLETVNIVLHAIFFQPFEYQGVYVLEMLLTNAKIAIQKPKANITSLLFRVLLTNCGFLPGKNHV